MTLGKHLVEKLHINEVKEKESGHLVMRNRTVGNGGSERK